jgi:hypothetical protein
VLCAGAPEPRARPRPKFNAGLRDNTCQAASAATRKRAQVGIGARALRGRLRYNVRLIAASTDVGYRRGANPTPSDWRGLHGPGSGAYQPEYSMVVLSAKLRASCNRRACYGARFRAPSAAAAIAAVGAAVTALPGPKCLPLCIILSLASQRTVHGADAVGSGYPAVPPLGWQSRLCQRWPCLPLCVILSLASH